MDELTIPKGYFSVLRWRRDATRDEAKNIAVLIVDDEREFGAIKSVSISSISRSLDRQGIVGALVDNLENMFASDNKPGLETLNELHDSLQRSLYLTAPKPVAVPDIDMTLDALYRAYVMPQTGGSKGVSKGQLITKTLNTFERRGLEVHRHVPVGGFTFDLVVRLNEVQNVVLDILSFATPRKDPLPVEHDAGYFLYAVSRSNHRAAAIVQPPTIVTTPKVRDSYGRVMSWFEEAEVPAYLPDILNKETVDELIDIPQSM